MSAAHEHNEVGVYTTCMDGRKAFNDHKIDILQKEPLFTVDGAGGALSFLLDLSREWMLFQIKAAVSITDTCKYIRLESHLGCGAYVLSGYTFDSLEDEIAAKWEDLHKAAGIINQAAPSLDVELILLDLDTNEIPDPAASAQAAA